MAERLLDPDEPEAVTFDNEAGQSVFLLTCDHAGRAIPRRLDNLGLPEHETERHIAWDIGSEKLGGSCRDDWMQPWSCRPIRGW